MAKSYSKNVVVPISFEIVNARVEEALIKSGFKNTRWSRAEGAFSAESPTSLWSWGENILIRTQEKGDQSEIFFTSTCKLPTQIFDWGKNKKNSNKFFEALEIS